MTTVKERPILFKGDMVRAIMEGGKTQTRRVVKPQPEDNGTGRWSYIVSSTDKASEDCFEFSIQDPSGNKHTNRGRERATFSKRSPFGQPGDHLWVREAWAHDAPTLEDCRRRHEDISGGLLGYGPYYLADVKADGFDNDGTWRGDLTWRPSIHMPRWASRILLEVVSVRVERLQEITAEGITSEGVKTLGEEMWGRRWFVGAPGKAFTDAQAAFRNTWDSLAAPGFNWADNPWVWAVEFKRVEVQS